MGIEVSVIIAAVITAFIGYQFNLRVKRSEYFLNELRNSYEELYFPMYMRIEAIKNTENDSMRKERLKDFFADYTNSSSNVKWLGTSETLAMYYVLCETYSKCDSTDKAMNEFNIDFAQFSKKAEKEFWEAHDIIYKDHLRFKYLSHKNSFLVALIEGISILYNFTSFLIYLGLLLIYFAISQQFINLKGFPEEITVPISLLIFLIIVMTHSLVLMLSITFVTKKNTRSEKYWPIIKQKILNKFASSTDEKEKKNISK